MHAYCATKLVNSASMSFEWEWALVVWEWVYPRVLTTFSISSLILQRWDGFFFSPLRWNCLFVRVENNRDTSESEGKLWGRGSAVNECRTVLLLGQFEYVFLIGLWRPRLLFSAFPQKCLHDVTVLSWGAQEQRCSFEARRTCSLSPTKGKIDLAESQGNLWEGGKKKQKKTWK